MTSILIAAAISGIVAGAHSNSSPTTPSIQSDDVGSVGPLESGGKHACKGQNACKGQGGCKSEKHACKGQNACKGQGGCKG